MLPGAFRLFLLEEGDPFHHPARRRGETDEVDSAGKGLAAVPLLSGVALVFQLAAVNTLLLDPPLSQIWGAAGRSARRKATAKILV